MTTDSVTVKPTLAFATDECLPTGMICGSTRMKWSLANIIPSWMRKREPNPTLFEDCVVVETLHVVDVPEIVNCSPAVKYQKVPLDEDFVYCRYKVLKFGSFASAPTVAW